MTICEKLRTIYDELEGPGKESITEKLIDALIMAKKMKRRLEYYHKTYKDTTGSNAVRLEPCREIQTRKTRRVN
jgi:hypothetical protein